METALNNVVILKQNRLEVKARIEENVQYAFYLHSSTDVEKIFYRESNKCTFDKYVEEGVYTVAFYRRYIDGKIRVENELFIVVDGEISLPKVLAETPEYKITYYNNNSDITFITFNGFGSTLKSQPFGLSFLLSKGYNVIACAQNKNQYQGLSFNDFGNIISPYIMDKKVFLYGSSLGGYCAVYYAGAVNGTVIAASPRNSLHPLMINKYSSKKDYKKFKHSNIVNNKISNKQVYIIFDPKLEMDVFFINQFVRPAYANGIYIELPYAGHEVLYHLNRVKYLSSLIESIVEGNVDIKTYSQLSHSEFTYYNKALESWVNMQNYIEKIRNIDSIHPLVKKRLDSLLEKLK